MARPRALQTVRDVQIGADNTACCRHTQPDQRPHGPNDSDSRGHRGQVCSSRPAEPGVLRDHAGRFHPDFARLASVGKLHPTGPTTRHFWVYDWYWVRILCIERRLAPRQVPLQALLIIAATLHSCCCRCIILSTQWPTLLGHAPAPSTLVREPAASMLCCIYDAVAD
jgi:hypothetical protein